MSQYEVPDPEDLVPCPYKAWEMIRFKRMPYHLQKCRKTYTGAEFATCPFNALHEMPRVELRYHIASCKDRFTVAQDLAWEKQKEEGSARTWGGDTSVPKETWEPPPLSEDWEEDIAPMPSYNLTNTRATERKKLKANSKALSQMTPAEKKAHLQRLRINFERRKQGLPPLEDDEPKKENTAPPQPLRPPRDMPSVYQLSMQQHQKQKPNPTTTAMPTVFTHSLLMAGIGRGRGVVKPPPAKPVQVPNGLGIGRGMPVQNAYVNSHPVVKDELPESPSVTTTPNMPSMANVSQEDTVAMYEKLMINLGMGRGLGRGMMPTAGLTNGIGGLSAGTAGFVVPKVPTVENTAPAHGPDGDSQEDIDTSREERKLRKKLRAIEVLEKKEASGVELSSDEYEKLARRSDLEQRLESLSLTER